MKKKSEIIFSLYAKKLSSKRLAESFIQEVLVPILGEGGSVAILFSGHLGAGKTQTIQWMARALGITERPKSPTFTLWHTHTFTVKNKVCVLHHVDAYRLKDPRELFSLDLKKAIQRPSTLCFIEWGDLLQSAMPKPFFLWHIDVKEKNTREIT